MGWVDSCSRRFWTRGAARNTALQRTKFNPFRVRAFVLRGLRLWISSRIYIYNCASRMDGCHGRRHLPLPAAVGRAAASANRVTVMVSRATRRQLAPCW